MSEVRQRWRLVFARDEEARYLSHLDAVRLWERAFRRGGIPVATSEGFSPRPKLVFAAPLQLGMLAEHELADLFLADRLTAPDLRDRLAAGMPRGYRVLDLYDVWVGAPAIAPQLVAADYRMTLLNVEAAHVERTAARLLARGTTAKGTAPGGQVRPRTTCGRSCWTCESARRTRRQSRRTPPRTPATGLWMRLRHSQDSGAGRAEEVVAALADELGLAAEVGSVDNEEAAVVDVVEAGGATLAMTRSGPPTRWVPGTASGGFGCRVPGRPVRLRPGRLRDRSAGSRATVACRRAVRVIK